ncbi:zinc finger protein 614 [Bombina bombina]|uniref:zinc finger protein 614 n=1 Tax=Bombina bombina TaxID=8345 RepID=UPI00235AA9D0|nr:zinc finger protein 614 [Bombina bombina]
MEEMKKHKEKMTERILNHALEIIYLLTGEEYTIVKKKLPHSSIHLLTGEVPIKCDDVAVYFSLEEWEYIEHHKDYYNELMLENKKNVSNLDKATPRDADVHDENEDIVSIGEEEGAEKAENEIQEVEIHSDICSELSDYNEENIDVISVNEEENTKLDSNIQPVTEICADGSVSVLEACSPLVISEDNSCISQGNQRDDSLEILPNDSVLYNSGNFISPPFYQCEQNASPLGETSERNHSAIRFTNEQFEEANYPDSDLNFNPNLSYIAHQKTTRVQKPHKCNECGKNFSYRCRLFVHRRTHASEKPHRCNRCGKHFATKDSLIIHERSHTGENPYHCDECGKNFAYKCRLIVHQRTHTGEKPHRCNECGKDFASKANLIIHQRKHTGESPYICKECGKRFISKPYLVAHKRSHTGEKPYMCNECGKQFVSKTNLIIHQRIHTGEKLHKCSECGKAFPVKSRLLQHQMVHEREKIQEPSQHDQFLLQYQQQEHICLDCGKTFDSRKSLTAHERTHRAGKST